MPVSLPKSQVQTPLLLLASVELAILLSSVYVAMIVIPGRVPETSQLFGAVALKSVLIAIVVLVCLVAMGLYDYHQRLHFSEAMVRVVVGIALACVVLAILFYAYPPLLITREIATIAICYSLLLLLVARLFFVRFVDEHIFRRATLLYGGGKRANSVSEIRRRADRRGFRVVAQVAAPGDNGAKDPHVLTLNGESIAEIAVENGAEEIVVAMDDRRQKLPIRELLDARLKGIDVIDLLEFLERETGKIRIDLVSPGWLIFSPGFRRSRFRSLSKRAFDVVVSGGLLLVGWPIMILVAAAIKMEDGLLASVFYRQLRVGQGNAAFNMLKFRSMTEDAENDGKAVWASENDNRITRVGKFLRKSRLDELPQIFNVFGGQMSIVGPRPERPEFIRDLESKIPYYSERHIVKPGLTGWAQLKYAYGASEDDAVEKLQYDLYYVKNQTMLLDVLIVLQTVEVVLWGKGAR